MSKNKKLCNSCWRIRAFGTCQVAAQASGARTDDPPQCREPGVVHSVIERRALRSRGCGGHIEFVKKFRSYSMVCYCITALRKPTCNCPARVRGTGRRASQDAPVRSLLTFCRIRSQCAVPAVLPVSVMRRLILLPDMVYSATKLFMSDRHEDWERERQGARRIAAVYWNMTQKGHA